MRILLAITHAGFGGVSNHVNALAGFLLEQGNEVFIACGAERTDFMQAFQESSNKVYVLKKLKRKFCLDDLLVGKDIRKLLLNNEFDIVHSHGPKAGFHFRKQCMNLSIPCVHTNHIVVYKQRQSVLNHLMRFAERAAAKWSEKIITVSDADKETLIEDGISPREKYVTIHNGIEISHEMISKQEARKELGIEQEEFVVLSSMRLETPKDPLTLIEGFKEFRSRNGSGMLFILGDGPLRQGLKEVSESEIREGYIEFRGFVKNVRKYLAASDVFVLSSFREGLPISIIEAMREGLPIVSNPVDGVVEEVIEDYNGYYFGQRDSHSLADILSDLLVNEEKRSELGEHSKKMFLKEFTSETNFRKIMTLYTEVIKHYRKN